MAFLLKDKKLEFTGVSIKSQSAAIRGTRWLGTLCLFQIPLYHPVERALCSVKLSQLKKESDNED